MNTLGLFQSKREALTLKEIRSEYSKYRIHFLNEIFGEYNVLLDLVFYAQVNNFPAM